MSKFKQETEEKISKLDQRVHIPCELCTAHPHEPGADCLPDCHNVGACRCEQGNATP